MNNLNIKKQIGNDLCRPVGTVSFVYESNDLFDVSKKGGIIFEHVTGLHVFRIVRNDELNLIFYHSSPGLGTRYSTIELNKVKQANRVILTFTWSPKEITFYIGPLIDDGQLVWEKGKQSVFQLRATNEGKIVEIDDPDKFMGVRILKGDKIVYRPPAIERWRDTLEAIKIIESGNSDKGYIYEVVITNSILMTLITGYEVYCKTRFIEIEKEGNKPNCQLLKEWKSRFDQIQEIEDKQLLNYFTTKRIINFQNYTECKDAYKKAYSIHFSSLGIGSEKVKLQKDILKYRHKIAHASPLVDVLNEGEELDNGPVFPNIEFRGKAISCIDEFINKLHNATINLIR